MATSSEEQYQNFWPSASAQYPIANRVWRLIAGFAILAARISWRWTDDSLS
jgi:hypothetical protein